MTKEEKEWLEAAMKQFTFSDTDKMKELLEKLKNKEQLLETDVLKEVL